jgi:hypothetical protein
VSILQGGLFWKWLSVKTSKGKRVLLHCYGRQGVSFLSAKLFDTMIQFKSNKEAKELIIPPGVIYRSIGVNNIDLDVINWSFFTHTQDVKHVPGIDIPAMANIHERALMKFNLNPMQDKIVLILLIFILVLLAFAVFKITGIPKLIVQACSTVTGGNI